MNKLKRTEKYLHEFFSNRYNWIKSFSEVIHKHRHTDIYPLNAGTYLMDFLLGIESRSSVYLSESLVPKKFASPGSLISSLGRFRDYLSENQKYLDMNYREDMPDLVIYDLQKIKDDLIDGIEYALKVYDYEDTVIPYQELRYNLIVNNIPGFISILKSILSSVSYSINKTKEGYYHSNVHLTLKLLGFDILSEEETNNGRIDAVIRFSDSIYIFEFKFDEEIDSSDEALNQIKLKEYHSKFTIERVPIYGIGVSFCSIKRNINGYKSEKLN
ncbi:MAG: PD-(D/E)XK nuclease domain-containing protein [Bacteroidetes bacterium]|nr:PD-(D/E)XK nuclease domain-containing protein [Bacteroidota bacterium]